MGIYKVSKKDLFGIFLFRNYPGHLQTVFTAEKPISKTSKLVVTSSEDLLPARIGPDVQFAGVNCGQTSDARKTVMKKTY